MPEQSCPVCGGMYKRLRTHMSLKHPSVGVEGEQGNSSSAPASTKIRYVSPRASGLTIIIKPTRRGFINTSGGSIETTIPGKSVTFSKGVLETDDPEVIDYLDHKYKDHVFPVVNFTKSVEAAKG